MDKKHHVYVCKSKNSEVEYVGYSASIKERLNTHSIGNSPVFKKIGNDGYFEIYEFTIKEEALFYEKWLISLHKPELNKIDKNWNFNLKIVNKPDYEVPMCSAKQLI